ncbi:ABC transporter substrate-binding protein [Prochlorococcus sp. MIT 1300]|uniref:ABC transporter substrate-binding protein n=1 Tax=Prochlorococcus sp. MIT 1300 TaxID=3096218 RepID=UPI002A766C03|nr:ABC transporter substrate-binding protein [Prochlorococcus sp. MIT 1300]
MKVKNYIITLIAVTILTILGSVVWPSQNTIDEINILMPAPFVDSTKESIEHFNKANTGKIKINVTRGPRETESVSDLAISSLLLGNSPFDVVLVDVTWLPKYAAANWLLPLNQLIEEKDLDSLAKGAEIGNSYNGILYRWPLVADMGLLYYRKDLMPEGPPKTPTELVQKSQKLQSENKVRWGYVWQGKQYEGLSCVFLEVINGFGGNWYSEEYGVKLSSSESIQAAQWLKDLINNGVSPRSVLNFTESEALQAFKSGDAAMMRNWPYAWAELQKADSPVKDKVAFTTMVSTEGNPPSSTLGSWGFSIMQSTKNPKSAVRAIKFLTSESVQKDLFLNNGYTPTRKNLFNDQSMVSNSPILKDLDTALKVTKPRPESPLYAQMSDILQSQLSALLTNKLSVHDSMNAAQKRTSYLLRSAGYSK